MSVLQECPICHRKQSNKNKKCVCGNDLDKVKKAGRMRYWITYRINGKQRFEYSGTDYDQAKASDGKRSCQKAEGRLLDIVETDKTTFNELAEWYLAQTAVTRLKSFARIKIGIQNFNSIFGENIVSSISKEDIIQYQEKRSNDPARRGPNIKPNHLKVSATTIDMEIMLTKTMINYAFEEKRIDGTALNVFRRIKKQVKFGTNAREKKLSLSEYKKILSHSPEHLKAFIIIALNTGMRSGEIRQLRWSNIDQDRRFIRLDIVDTKEKNKKVIPINHNVKSILDSQLRWIRHDYVLTYMGNPISTPGGIRLSFKKAVEDAGIIHGRDNKGGLVFHDLRRTAKTLMVDAEVDKVQRDFILGHAMQGMDRHYIVPDDDKLMAAMDKYTNHLDKLGW